MNTRDLTPGDRRELRSLVRKQFVVLRNDVKRRAQELRGEIEAELLRRYRTQDEAIAEAQEQANRARADFELVMEKVCADLRLARPELNVSHGGRFDPPETIRASDPNRGQTHAALVAAIPGQIAAAATQLDQDELGLLRDLTVGALSSEVAQEFLSRIPTVGMLVPTARLVELEGS